MEWIVLEAYLQSSFALDGSGDTSILFYYEPPNFTLLYTSGLL